MNQLGVEKQKHVNPAQLPSMFPKYSQLSRCHELLASIPFAAAITTNYDDLLDRVRSRWIGMVVTPRAEEVRRLSGIPFLLKLYCPSPRRCGSRAAKLAEDFPNPARELINRVGAMNTLFFVGASIEGLLADLDALGLAEIRGGTHFAVGGRHKPAMEKGSQRTQGPLRN